MNANIPKISDINKLTRYHKKMIIGSVIRPEDNYIKKAERLRALKIFEDDVKFQVLRESELVSNELYDCLYDIYFGVVKKPETLFEPKPVELYKYNEEKKTSPELLEGFEEVPVTVVETDKKYLRFSKEKCKEFIDDYLNGMSNEELAEKYRLTKRQVIQKLADYRRRENVKEKPKMNKAKETQAEAPAETISDALTALDVNPEKLPKAFTAKGKGFLTTDSGIKLDEEPIITLLRQKIIEKGLRQFYAEVEIIVRPSAPAGMTVNVEE